MVSVWFCLILLSLDTLLSLVVTLIHFDFSISFFPAMFHIVLCIVDFYYCLFTDIIILMAMHCDAMPFLG